MGRASENRDCLVKRHNEVGKLIVDGMTIGGHQQIAEIDKMINECREKSNKNFLIGTFMAACLFGVSLSNYTIQVLIPSNSMGLETKQDCILSVLHLRSGCKKNNAIGIYSMAGPYGRSYAHKDIAFNFGMWLSPTFQLYVV